MHVFADLHTHTKLQPWKELWKKRQGRSCARLEQVAINDHGPASWFTVGTDFGILGDSKASQALRSEIPDGSVSWP